MSNTNNKPPQHNGNNNKADSKGLSWQQQLLNSSSSQSSNHTYNKRSNSGGRRRPSNGSSNSYHNSNKYRSSNNSYYHSKSSRRTPTRRSPLKTGNNNQKKNSNIDFGQLSVAQIKKRLPDALKNRNYKLAVLLLRNVPGKPMLKTSSGDPPNFNMIDILNKLYIGGQTTHVADFVLKVMDAHDDYSDKIELAFSGPKLISKMVEQHRFDHAINYLRKFQLQGDTELKNYIFQRMIKEGQYDRCLAEAERLKLSAEEMQKLSPEEKDRQVKHLYKSIITNMLKRGRIETALKHIDNLGVVDHFNIGELFRKLCDKNDFPPILRFAGRYNLIEKFPSKTLVQKMLDNGLWAEAWKTVQMKGLTKIFPLNIIIKKAAKAGNFSTVAQFIEDHNLAPRMSKTLDEFESNLMDQISRFELSEAEKAKNKIPNSPRRPSIEGLQDKVDDDEEEMNRGNADNSSSTSNSKPDSTIAETLSPKSNKADTGVLKPVMTIEYPAPPTKNRELLQAVVKEMIDQRKWYFAMKYSLDYNLATIFPPAEIIEKMIDDEEYSLALRYIVGLGEYDHDVAEKFFPMIPFIREERASKRLQFLSRVEKNKIVRRTNINDNNNDVVCIEKVLSIDTKDIVEKADNDGAINEEKGSVIGDNNEIDYRSERLSPSSSLMKMLKGNNNSNNNDSLSRSMMLKASLDAFDDSMALHEEENLVSPAGSPEEKSSFMVSVMPEGNEAMFAKNSNVDSNYKNKVDQLPSQNISTPSPTMNNDKLKSSNEKVNLPTQSTFSNIFNQIDNHGDDDDSDSGSDDEEEIVLLSPGRQSSHLQFASGGISNKDNSSVKKTSNMNRMNPHITYLQQQQKRQTAATIQAQSKHFVLPSAQQSVIHHRQQQQQRMLNQQHQQQRILHQQHQQRMQSQQQFMARGPVVLQQQQMLLRQQQHLRMPGQSNQQQNATTMQVPPSAQQLQMHQQRQHNNFLRLATPHNNNSLDALRHRVNSTGLIPQQQQQQQQRFGNLRQQQQHMNRMNQSHVMQLAMPPSTQQFFKAGPMQHGWPVNQAMPMARPTNNNVPNSNALPTSSGFALPIYMKKKT